MSTVLHYYRGRVALHATLRALHVSAGDEVVVPAYTCAAAIEPLLRLGVRPVFADIDRDALSPDPAATKKLINDRTRAVIVQHTFGYPARIAEVPVPVIENCAHIGPGSIPAGDQGVAAFYSYEWGKPVVAGVGGAAVVHDPALAAEMHTRYPLYTAPPPGRELVMAAEYLAYRLAADTGVLWRVRTLYRRLAGLGVVTGSYAEDPERTPEYGWRMIRGVRQRLPRRVTAALRDIDVRRKVLAAYERGLDRIGVSHHPRPGPEAVPLRLPVRVFGKDDVLREAAAAGVELGDWYRTPVHPLSGRELAAAGYLEGSCPNAEWAAKHLVTLPLRSSLRPADVNRALHLFDRLKARGHV
ncbi:DegT/DnrJ/EryC1/StrS family aminotransferase [Actinoplanes regularis]|uniref:dTDP-4-amino-4,6-dideoxygalactose transaminase n=1 Tax=Actinoplanes regularis TaxID=52697 RepID=A0A238ZR71_9ACTN|nr:DegT/DnrJ/EryC1/StrS family aminotransferase [Actinoplanes regularis]GIE87513.1 hypothetical protein Are01nite_39930 [Actinoplanes regularis]SNR85448.1 dTDP-4-amino-4,6-dideoxygalactose transaminase [Actinoplanes regularis]